VTATGQTDSVEIISFHVRSPLKGICQLMARNFFKNLCLGESVGESFNKHLPYRTSAGAQGSRNTADLTLVGLQNPVFEKKNGPLERGP
jgi:hypothetical protein